MFKNFIYKIVLCLLIVSSSLASAEMIPLSEEAKSLKKGIYQHYKGALYEVAGIAHHSETLEELVIYRILYGDFGYWVRPVSLFCELVEIEDNQMVPRFKFIGEPGNLAID